MVDLSTLHLKFEYMLSVIIGARADGHASVVLQIILSKGEHSIAGFIDDDPAKKGQIIKGYPVLGSMHDLAHLKATEGVEGAIVAIGDNDARLRLMNDAQEAGLEIIDAIHPTVWIDPDVTVGKGCYMGQGVCIVTGTVIGDGVNIHTGATIDHDNRISSGANLGPGVHTAGRVNIGDCAFLGTGCSVIPDISIGHHSIIGAGAVVNKNIPPNVTAVGVPAKVIKSHS